MNHPSASPAPPAPLSGGLRLVLAISAAVALGTLCWAALQVRAARAEANQAQQAATRAQEQLAAVRVELTDRIAEIQRLKSGTETSRHDSEVRLAAEVKQREEVIAFLRTELNSAEQTIKRLTEGDVATAAAAAPAEPDSTGAGQANEKFAVGRAEALNASISQFVHENGRTVAQEVWNRKTNAERYDLVKPYLAYAPGSIAEYQPAGFTYTFPAKPDSRVEITRLDKNGMATPVAY